MVKELKARSSAKQDRSKEKKQKLISVTKELIGTKGSADVSMREIANQANIPIASVYHYYPNKDAILAEIMQGVFSSSRERMEILFKSIQHKADLREIIEVAVNNYFEIFANDPALAIIWANVQASPELLKLDMEDTRLNARMISDILTEKFPGFDYQETLVACFSLLCYSTYISRMVTFLDSVEAKELKDELKVTIALRVQYLLDH